MSPILPSAAIAYGKQLALNNGANHEDLTLISNNPGKWDGANSSLFIDANGNGECDRGEVTLNRHDSGFWQVSQYQISDGLATKIDDTNGDGVFEAYDYNGYSLENPTVQTFTIDPAPDELNFINKRNRNGVVRMKGPDINDFNISQPLSLVEPDD
jgi:hypothetical protein